MNEPYVKQLNQKGEVINPITKHNPIVNHYDNRRQRRANQFTGRFKGNNKGNSIVVLGKVKYFKVLQNIFGKVINHSLTK